MKSLLQSVAHCTFKIADFAFAQFSKLLTFGKTNIRMPSPRRAAVYVTLSAFQPFLLVPARSQPVPAPQLAAARVDDTMLTVLKGNVPPLARPEFDRGEAPADLRMDRMLLLLKRTPAQEAALDNFLAQQLDPASVNFHRWLSPQQFGTDFGLPNEDIEQVTSWLEQHGFQVSHVSRGRTVIEFSGTASQVSEAFLTAIHKYVVDGEPYWANAQDPSIPSVLTSAVAGLVSLNDFPPHLPLQVSRARADRASGGRQPAAPEFTFDGRCGSLASECYGLSPADLATIYNLSPLWDSGIDGAGQAIAIVAASNVNMRDVRDFRTLFGLPPHDPVIVLNGADPGLVESPTNPIEAEAVIDLEWAGAVAPAATLYLVVSKSTKNTFGMDLSAEYAVDNNLAPILSASYAGCEKDLGATGNQFYSSLWQQAAAEGITVLVATGDSGSAGCENFRASPPAPASSGLQVNGRGSTPYNTAVGGTDFNDAGNWSTYWNPTNDHTTHASALGYVPEMVWNDSCSNAAFGAHLDPESNCNDPTLTALVGVFGGSGGVSTIYTKPSWQDAPGVPNDGMRDLPDVSLFAAGGQASGSFYVLCEADLDPDGSGARCDLNPPFQHFAQAGGTSVSVQVFAGMMALVNQKANSRQGNIGPVLYALARQQAGLFCDAGSPGPGCVYHDITVGTNAVPCKPKSRDCTRNDSSHTYGVLTGYNASPSYDLATGLGSVNATNLVIASGWAANPAPDFALSSPNSAVTIPASGGSGALTLTIASVNGFSGAFDLGPGSCSGLPLATTCSFSPSSVTIDARNPAATIIVTITNKGSATSSHLSRSPRSGSGKGLAFSILFCLGLPPLFWRRSRRRLILSCILLAVASLPLAGCGGGGGGNNGGGGSAPTPNPGTINPVITIKSGNTTHSMIFALTLE